GRCTSSRSPRPPVHDCERQDHQREGLVRRTMARTAPPANGRRVMRPDRSVTTVIIGGGHNGLAMSKRLADRGIDHVVLERGDVANAWRTQRWDSFTLLTPNWQTRLPGRIYDGEDPDGFMTAPEIAGFIEEYAALVGAPVQTGTTVTAVRSSGDTFLVGAAATGIQLADEIHASGRPVTLSVGEHVRMPRTYRGRDIQHWMEVIGRLDERYDEVEEILKARAVA